MSAAADRHFAWPTLATDAAAPRQPATFTISTDVARSLVRITMGGFFGAADFARFVKARAEAHRPLRCPRNAHVTVNDLREMKIQSQDMVSAFQNLLAAPDYRSRRLAFVVGPTLARSQVMRAMAGRTARCFDSVEAAETWLFEE